MILLYAAIFLLLLLVQISCQSSFYMIEPERFLLFRECSHEASFNDKHFDAVFFVDVLREHPWRVFDPKQADLVIVPALLDLLAEGKCESEHYNAKDFIEDIAKAIGDTGVFPSKRHAVLAFDWKSSGLVADLRKHRPEVIMITFENFNDRDCHSAVGYGNNYDFRALYPFVNAPKNGQRLHHRFHLSRRGHDDLLSNLPMHQFTANNFFNRTIFVEFSGQADSRPAYGDRFALLNSSINDRFVGSVFITTQSVPDGDFANKGKVLNVVPKHHHKGPKIKACGHQKDEISSFIKNPLPFEPTAYDRCYISFDRGLAQGIREASKFSLCFRGDTPGSDRWINAFLGGTLIVTVAETVEEAVSWAPFQSVIPWKEIVVWIPRAVYRNDPVKALNGLADLSLEDVVRRLDLMKNHIADLSFIAPESRFADNTIKEAIKCACHYYPHSNR
eukprot:gene2098-2237_t